MVVSKWKELWYVLYALYAAGCPQICKISPSSAYPSVPGKSLCSPPLQIFPTVFYKYCKKSSPTFYSESLSLHCLPLCVTHSQCLWYFNIVCVLLVLIISCVSDEVSNISLERVIKMQSLIIPSKTNGRHHLFMCWLFTQVSSLLHDYFPLSSCWLGHGTSWRTLNSACSKAVALVR